MPLGAARPSRSRSPAPFAAAQLQQFDRRDRVWRRCASSSVWPGDDKAPTNRSCRDRATVVEVVAEIVVSRDVAAAAAPGVAVQRMTKFGQWLRRVRALRTMACRCERRPAALRNASISASTIAGEIGLGEAEIAAGQQPQHALPAVDRHMRAFGPIACRRCSETPSARRLQHESRPHRSCEACAHEGCEQRAGDVGVPKGRATRARCCWCSADMRIDPVRRVDGGEWSWRAAARRVWCAAACLSARAAAPPSGSPAVTFAVISGWLTKVCSSAAVGQFAAQSRRGWRGRTRSPPLLASMPTATRSSGSVEPEVVAHVHIHERRDVEAPCGSSAGSRRDFGLDRRST